MRSLNLHGSLRHVIAALAVAVFAVSALPVGAVPWDGDRHTFASPRFEDVSRSADAAVQQGRATRSWTWVSRLLHPSAAMESHRSCRA